MNPLTASIKDLCDKCIEATQDLILCNKGAYDSHSIQSIGEILKGITRREYSGLSNNIILTDNLLILNKVKRDLDKFDYFMAKEDADLNETICVVLLALKDTLQHLLFEMTHFQAKTSASNRLCAWMINEVTGDNPYVEVN